MNSEKLEKILREMNALDQEGLNIPFEDDHYKKLIEEIKNIINEKTNEESDAITLFLHLVASNKIDDYENPRTYIPSNAKGK